jgi:UDP-N-acetylglucosamine--N-acetylmuramyl-(pentapeptide) pyrophosphoryl-undecaprenol N-acetylglucosamine transferase
MSIQRVIISGGGTGGHIFPAVAIADEIKRRNPSAAILFVGAIGKMEMEKVPQAGYEIVGLPIAGFQRKLTLSNFLLPFKILKSLLLARTIVKKFNPQFVKMSGSGSTIFAIFKDSSSLKNAHQNLQKIYANFYIKNVKILQSLENK